MLQESTEKNMLINELKSEVDISVDKIFEKIKKHIVTYAALGWTSIRIYIPATDNSKTITQYNTIMYGLQGSFKDVVFRNKLIKKFKTHGIKLEIENAVKSFYDYYYYIKYIFSGYILEIKWDKNYSKSSCCNII